jgi:alpha-tubulin suppressor-like RCC1 family protein
LENETSYYYVVSAANSFGVSAPSAEVTATPGFRPRSLASSSTSSHCLCLFEDGSVWGWGLNIDGETGNGQSGNQFRPAEALNLPKVTALSRGGIHSIALANDGTVWTWGGNNSGQIGNGMALTLSVLTPFQVPGLSNVTAVAAGSSHNLVLRNDGSVWSWGSNGSGELGRGATSPPDATPAAIPGLSGITAIAAGASFSMALKADGTVWTWGTNQYGQIGSGAASLFVATPYQVDNLNNVTEIVPGGVHCLALRNDGSVWAWGDDTHGQVGNGPTSTSPVTRPVQVVNLTGALAIAAGSMHSLALKSDGTVWSWGDNADVGALGNGAKSGIVNAPTQILGLSDIAAIAGGATFGIALGNDGSTWIWGSNGNGELGIGGGPVEELPEEVINLTGVTAVAAGDQHSVALRSDGTVWSWGSNAFGQFGNGATTNVASSTPTPASVLSGVTALSAGGNHGLAIRSNGSVWAWGHNINGQIGNGSAADVGISTPIQVNVLSGVFTEISAGFAHNLALKNDGTVWAWGWNAFGQIGNGNTTTPVTNPIQVPGLTGMTAVSAGFWNSMALRNDGTVWVWGANGSGQVGNGSAGATPVSSPFQVPGLGVMKAVAVGNLHSLAVQNDGTVWAWGDNTQGQIGNGGTASPVLAPVQIPGLSGITALSAGPSFSEALKNDGTVWAWGQNASGQLGDGTTTALRTNPVQTLGLSGVTSFSAGKAHSLARLPSGLVRAWGSNNFLVLGKPVVTISVIPVQVSN